MDFLCKCCKRRITRSAPHKLIEGANLHSDAYHFEWAVFDDEEMSKPINERIWSLRNIQPLAGDERILRVKVPFDEEIGDLFTTFYEPWQMFLNGWDNAEKPEDIYKACGVLCRFDEVLWADEYSAFILVKIFNVVPVGDFCKVLPLMVTDRDFIKDFGFGCEDETEVYYRDERLLCRVWAGQDTAEMQVLYTDDRGVPHEIIDSWEDHHSNDYSLGNYIMG